MTMSHQTFTLSKPVDGEKIPPATIEYFRARNQNNVHNLILEKLVESNLTQAEVCKRLGRRPDVVCRWIGAPGNWTLDTVSDLLFAISGEEIEYRTADPIDYQPRNHTQPEWLTGPKIHLVVGEQQSATGSNSSKTVTFTTAS